MDKDVCAISFNGLIYSVTRSPYDCVVSVGDQFAKEMVNPLKTEHGSTGDMHRKHLHDLLDEWIDNGIKVWQDAEEAMLSPAEVRRRTNKPWDDKSSY